jgi:hypothetical protein
MNVGGINFFRAWQKDSDDDQLIFNFNNDEKDTIFRTNQNSPGLKISGSGDVGIHGISTPLANLHVGGNILADTHISASGHVSASFYYGDGSNLTGINAGIQYSRRAISTHATASVNDTILGVSGAAAINLRLPSAGDYATGQYFTVKDESGAANTKNITILTSGSQTIDGQSSIALESPYAAVNIYSNGTDKFFIY